MAVKAIHGSRFVFPGIRKMPDDELKRIKDAAKKPQRKDRAGGLPASTEYIIEQSRYWDEKRSPRDSPIESGKDAIGTFELLPDLKKHIQRTGGGRILDIGSGRMGQTAHEIAKMFPNCSVTGLDIVPAMTAAETRDAMHGTVRGESSILPFDDNKFSIVHSTNTLAYLFNKLGAFKEMIRVARDGGVIMVQYIDKPLPMLEYEPHTGKIKRFDIAKALADVGIDATQKTHIINGVKSHVICINKRASDYDRAKQLPFDYFTTVPHPEDGSIISFYTRKK